MEFARRMATTASALLLALLFAGSATAQVNPTPAHYLGHLQLDLSNGSAFWVTAPPAGELAGNVYDNTSTFLGSGIALTDLNARYGDRVATTGMGNLLENDFTIYNAAGGNLLSTAFQIQFYNATSNAFIGQYTTSQISFGSGLPPGNGILITVTGLSGTGINLNTTDVLMVQKVISPTGGATSLGVVFFDPPTIGSSPAYMFIDTPLIGPPGYYSANSGQPLDPGYRINVDQVVSTHPASWGLVKSLYH
jgi:hypothetical protein